MNKTDMNQIRIKQEISHFVIFLKGKRAKNIIGEIPFEVPESKEKKTNVTKLLLKHVAAKWRENPTFDYYRNIIDFAIATVMDDDENELHYIYCKELSELVILILYCVKLKAFSYYFMFTVNHYNNLSQ